MNVTFVFEKKVRRVQAATGWKSPNLHIHDTVFNFFYICFKRASKIRLQDKLKCNFFPVSATEAHTKRTFIKIDHDHSQTAGSGKNPTV